ncbi:MAG: TRAP transporter small permease [Deltaproteobacteria bacterium]|nr:TRAP transporter small permease [Deltaproteobacteria bacterium]
MNALCQWAVKLHIFSQRLEEGLLCLLLVAMIVLGCLQIVLRSAFSGGLLWADPLLRYLVIWSGMLGAAVATRNGKHIALDVLSHLLPLAVKSWLRMLIHFFSTAVAIALTWAAVIFIRNEAQFGGAALLSIPSWIWNLVFPLSFGLIAFRFLAAGIAEILTIASRSPAGKP